MWSVAAERGELDEVFIIGFRLYRYPITRASSFFIPARTWAPLLSYPAKRCDLFLLLWRLSFSLHSARLSSPASAASTAHASPSPGLSPPRERSSCRTTLPGPRLPCST